MNKLALGTAQFGMPYGVANQKGQVQPKEITAILSLAQTKGINTLDTAKVYGTSEEVIGNYLRVYSNTSWQIITKISDDQKRISRQIQDSIEKLTICPNSVLAHSAELFLNDVFQEELQKVREHYPISSTGVSLYNEDEINQVLDSDFKPGIIQLPLNILDTRLYRRGMLRQLDEEGIKIHVRSVFLQGLFYLPEVELKHRFSHAVPYLNKLNSIAAGSGLTLAELSLLWLNSLNEVSKIVIGVDSATQLKQHLETLKKNVGADVIQEALSVRYENEKVLNPALWT